MFHYFTLSEVYAYALQMGYTREDVEIVDAGEYYDVSFGHEYTEMWCWEFDSLDAPAVYYEHMVWED